MPHKDRRDRDDILPPRLSALTPVETLPEGRLLDRAVYTQLELSNPDLAEQTAAGVLFEQVQLKHGNLSRTRLSKLRLIDVRFETCDMAGAEWERAHFRRVEVVGSRLVGAKLAEASLTDTLIKACNAEFALFWSATFKAARFEQCVLREASFVGANLAGVVFHQCDLSHADLRETQLAGADFRGSTIAGMQVGVKELQGAIIDPAQAAQIVGILGVVVKPADDFSASE
ncbi:MAG TPA: pentapeptide repeat-containing protein [Anaerolineae bacterium]|nr:pentapeptide repeat-containing protein [Anaerolineae bacterium]